jgi:Ca-activated chloride channel homolog
MRHGLPVCLLVLAAAGTVEARGILIPEDKSLPPLAMVRHRVDIAIQDQAAVTTVEQTFRNHTSRQLEATYVFPLPSGANVNKFTMWVDGKEQAGELLDSKKAAEVYQSIVRRSQDPGLLEYMGNNLMRLRIFPVPPHADQKVKISFTSLSTQDNGVVEYVYPIKTDGKATKTLEELSITASVRSQHPIQNIYSPTHAINIVRKNDNEATVTFERNQAMLDKDFMLFYSVGGKEIGITPLMHKPLTSEDGYVMLLLSPQLESAKNTVIPRDLVLVLDTSGSMDATKMEQARKALRYCLSNLNSQDRFGVVSFATSVRHYRDALVDANNEQVENAKKWVDGLRAGGGTAMQAALDAALDFRSSDSGRSFTVVFFTDGQPTLGEMKPENILRNVADRNKNSVNTRIFTFGVGDDVNTTFLDKLADSTRAVSTYVRPAEDIETKVASLYGKMTRPVLANVKLAVSGNIRLFETYPQQLPDIFWGSQLVVLGKYSGTGPAAIKLTGQVGKEQKEFAFDVKFPSRTVDDKEFVENLWARRKVGFLLDQIRANGEQKELMDEMLTLAKKYGIATPYTSFLVVPDAPMPIVTRPFDPKKPMPQPRPTVAPGLMIELGGGTGGVTFTGATSISGPVAQSPVIDFAKKVQPKPEEGGKNRAAYEDKNLEAQDQKLEQLKKDGKDGDRAEREKLQDNYRQARGNFKSYDQARQWLNQRDLQNVQGGNSTAVDIAMCSNGLRTQERLTQTAMRHVNGHNCLEIGGVWIDEGFAAQMKTVVVKAQSDAYFRILERNAKMKAVFVLGNYLVYVTPSKTALIVDTTGKEQLTDEEIDKLFVAAK